MRTRLSQLVALTFFPAVYLCGISRAPAAEAAKSPGLDVATTHLSRGPITRGVTLPGEVKPYQSVTLYAKVGGYLKSIAVDKGDTVQAGALLAEIEVPELIADEARIKAELEFAEIDYNRTNDAQKKAPDLVVPLALDTAKAKFDIAKANLQRAEVLLQFTKITAPFSGVITKRMVDVGSFVPAATTPTAANNAAIVTVMDFNTVRLQVAVPEMEAHFVAKDQVVKITTDDLPGRSYEGKISRFAYAMDEASRTMLAEIDIPNPKLELRPGMFASVRIGIETKPDVLLAPVDAVVIEKAGALVFSVRDGRAIKTPVKIGFNDGKKIEIISGVSPEAALVLVGKRPLSDGQLVNVTETK